jgi:DsbC/DsbD-like thiol-disulfide interchange protein
MFRTVITSVFLALSGAAQAQSFGEPAMGEILPGWREQDGQHMAGLAIRLSPGWKTYWRSPGDGGIPPQFNWSGSQNLQAVTVRYPVPKVMRDNGLQSIGYDKDVVFALIVQAVNPRAPVQLKGDIQIGVCEDICIPMTLSVQGTLPATGAPDAEISASLTNQPVAKGMFGCEIEPIADGLRLRATARVDGPRPEVAIIEPGEPGVWTSRSGLEWTGDAFVTEVEMVPPTAAPFALARNDVRLTLIGNGQAIELKGCR